MIITPLREASLVLAIAALTSTNNSLKWLALALAVRFFTEDIEKIFGGDK